MGHSVADLPSDMSIRVEHSGLLCLICCTRSGMAVRRREISPRRQRTRRPKKKKFVLRRITAEEADLAIHVANKIEKLLKYRRLIAYRYSAWCRLNKETEWTPRSISMFCGVIRHQLSPGTATKIITELATLELARRTNPLQNYLRLQLRDAHLDYAKRGVVHSVDFLTYKLALDSAWAIQDERCRFAALLMVVCGFRLRDIQLADLATEMTIVAEARRKEIRFELRTTKNRRSVWRRITVVLVRSHLRAASVPLLEYMKRSVGRLAVSRVTQTMLTNALRPACADVEISTIVTPGSLRRAYVRHIIHLYTFQGAVDWPGVIKVTGHKNVDTVRAFYE